MEMSLIQKIIIWALPVLFAITVHEVAHGWVAMKFGDKTAFMLGRVTLNPIKHIDPIGTLLVPGILLALGGIVFGWAKPVPVVQRNLRNPRRDMALVAVAGPCANLLMALLWALVMKLGLWLGGVMPRYAIPVIYMGQAGIFINLMLMVLNLVPLPPLDGGRFVSCVLPPKIAYHYDKIEPFGFLILIILLATKILAMILSPVIFYFWHLISVLFQLG
jgi:Zn-dependent protease